MAAAHDGGAEAVAAARITKAYGITDGVFHLMRTCTVAFARCPDAGLHVGYVPGLPGTQNLGGTLGAVVAMLHDD